MSTGEEYIIGVSVCGGHDGGAGIKGQDVRDQD